jgi:pyroglutamyl-peptidase
MRILVSGFEPFLDEKVNPTAEIVRFVNSCGGNESKSWPSQDVRAVLLPVLFDDAFLKLERERQMFRPDVILSFGLAGGRTSIDIEQLAINFRGADTGKVVSAAGSGTGHTATSDATRSLTKKRADNAGIVGSGAIDIHAPLSLPTTLPIALIIESLRSKGVAANVSFSAGTYVCNDLFFQMQNRLRFTKVRSGFIHVPRMCAGLSFDGTALAGEAFESETAWPWSRFEVTVRAILVSLAR